MTLPAAQLSSPLLASDLEPRSISGASHGAQVTARARPVSDSERLERAAREDFQFIWRCVRRLGVHPDHAVDDAVQRVFEIAASRVADILPGHERAFLFKTAVFVTKEARRKWANAREVSDAERIEAELDAQGNPEQLLAEARWRLVLDALLEALPIELRTVFVLFELEGLHMVEIAELLALPPGTVASRLRRARAEFQDKGQKLKARLGTRGGEP